MVLPQSAGVVPATRVRPPGERKTSTLRDRAAQVLIQANVPARRVMDHDPPGSLRRPFGPVEASGSGLYMNDLPEPRQAYL